MICRQRKARPHPQNSEKAVEDTTVITRGTPRGLLGSIGLIAIHS
jgi:hypothetical protein